jgi:hypothetical protein
MKVLKMTCVVALILGLATCVYAAEGKRTAEIISLNGTAEVKLAGQTSWSPAQVGTILNEGDTLKTGLKSEAVLNVDGKGQTATVDVSENSNLLLSAMMLDQKAGTSRTLLDLAMGEILIMAQKVKGEQSKFEVKTPTSIVGVRGTTFRVKVEAVEE